MLRDENGELKFCPFSGNINGSFGRCKGEKCVAYDVVPSEYTADWKPVERCLMMQLPFIPAPYCCGHVTESKEDRGDE